MRWYQNNLLYIHRYSILFQEIKETGFPEGWYYAHVPALNLTTQGEGLEGAREAAIDLLQLWFAEKQAHGEEIPKESTSRASRPARPKSTTVNDPLACARAGERRW
jgi:predicted RNase H-like HicB family nuclease